MFFFCVQFPQNIDGFRQNDSQGFLQFIEIYKQNPLEKFFHNLPKLYIGFNTNMEIFFLLLVLKEQIILFLLILLILQNSD